MMLLGKQYPNRYELPTFSQYDGRKGSAIEHVSKFVDTMGSFVAGKSMCGHAYTWYTGLKPGSIPTWDDMVDFFLL